MYLHAYAKYNLEPDIMQSLFDIISSQQLMESHQWVSLISEEQFFAPMSTNLESQQQNMTLNWTKPWFGFSYSKAISMSGTRIVLKPESSKVSRPNMA